MAENGFPRVSRHGHRGSQEDHGRNGRKWQKKGCRGYLVGNGFPRVSRHGSRGSQEDHGQNGRKWSKMVEKSSPRENGRKWISARFTSFPYYLLTSRFWLKSWIIRSTNNISILADYEDTLSDPNFISSNILPICHWVR